MRCVVQECVTWSNLSSVYYNYGVYNDGNCPDDMDYDSLKEMGAAINQFIERKEAENDKG